MARRGFLLALPILGLTGCSTTGKLGLISKSTANPGSILTESTGYKEIGPARGEACRHFVLGVIPTGQSDMAAAVDKALAETGGDALINVSTESSLYGFIPVYSIYSFTCTRVRGTAIRFE